MSIIAFKVDAPVYRDRLRGALEQLPGLCEISRLSDAERTSIRVLVTSGHVGLSAAEMDLLPHLGLVCCIGTGHENVDLAAAAERGVRVTNAAGANAASVADHAIALLLALLRGIPEYDASARAGTWRGALTPRPTLSGKRLGIVGYGGIGRRVADRAAGFDVSIAYTGRAEKPDVPWRYVASIVALAEMSDILILCAPGGAATRGMVDAQVLKALGPAGYLVNVGRGSLVDTPALIAALHEGDIAGAALDVFETEPEIPAGLRTAPNILLSPHIAGVTVEAQAVSAALMRRNVEAYLANAPLVTPVERPRAG